MTDDTNLADAMNIPPTSTAARTRLRRSASTQTAALETLRAELRQELRKEIRNEELASLREKLAQQNEIMETSEDRLISVQEKVDGIHAMLSQAMLEIPGTSLASPGAALELGEQVNAMEDSKDDIIVTNAFLDFIEVHASMCKSVIERRPLLSNIRAAYSAKNEMQLMINRGGTYGTGESMRNPILTLRIHDEYPFIEGEYMEMGKTIPMSEEQVDRVAQELVVAVRKALPDEVR